MAGALSLAFRVRSMVYLESIQLNFQPPSMGWLLLYCLFWGTGQSHIGGCQQLNSACGPLLKPMPWSCVICLYRHSLCVPGAPGEQQNQSWLEEFFASLHFLEALAISLPDQTPLSDVGLVLNLTKDEKGFMPAHFFHRFCRQELGNEQSQYFMLSLSIKQTLRFETCHANSSCYQPIFYLCST